MFHIYKTIRTSQNHNQNDFIFNEKNYMRLALIVLKHLYPYCPTKEEFIDAIDPITPSNYLPEFITRCIYNVASKNEKWGVKVINYSDEDYRLCLTVAPKKFKITSILNRIKMHMIKKIRMILGYNEDNPILPLVLIESVPTDIFAENFDIEEKDLIFKKALEELVADGWIEYNGIGEQINLIH